MEKIGNITLYNADCIDVMRTFKDKEFDLAIVDPPYGIGIDGQKLSICKNPKHNRKFFEKKNWDVAPSQEYFNELIRVSKNQIIWGGNYFIDKIPFPTKCWLAWYKGQEGLTMSDFELAWTSFSRPARLVEINRFELKKEGTIHPTQKPVKLYLWILKQFAKPGMKILDTFGGSMSSMIACYKWGGVEATCIEIDPDYYRKGVERLKREVEQMDLFIPNQETIEQQSLF